MAEITITQQPELCKRYGYKRKQDGGVTHLTHPDVSFKDKRPLEERQEAMQEEWDRFPNYDKQFLEAVAQFTKEGHAYGLHLWFTPLEVVPFMPRDYTQSENSTYFSWSLIARGIFTTFKQKIQDT